VCNLPLGVRTSSLSRPETVTIVPGSVFSMTTPTNFVKADADLGAPFVCRASATETNPADSNAAKSKTPGRSAARIPQAIGIPSSIAPVAGSTWTKDYIRLSPDDIRGFSVVSAMTVRRHIATARRRL
jgi:hypothetical protein